MNLSALLKAHQLDSGAFKSYVWRSGRPLLDQNGFITSLVLRELRGIDEPALVEIRRRALAYVMRCEAGTRPGTFSFWPADDHPFWMKGQRLYEDADDTAVNALELVRHGLRPVSYLALVAERLQQFCVDDSDAQLLPWQQLGVYYTWLHRLKDDNPIDCCVNTNVVALLAFAGLKALPGYSAACTMINQTVAWAGTLAETLVQTTPYYPHPIELYYAIRHAVAVGASELQPALTALEPREWVQAILTGAPQPDRLVCGDVGGHVYWSCEILQRIRQIDPMEPES